MLYIFVDRECLTRKEYETRISICFDIEFEKTWLKDKFNQKVLKAIDNVDVIQDELLYNDIMGYLPPEHLSTGVKTLMLVNSLDLKVDGDRMGDNCYPFLIELSTQKDIYIKLTHLPKFNVPFETIFINTNKYVSTWKDFVLTYMEEMYNCNLH